MVQQYVFGMKRFLNQIVLNDHFPVGLNLHWAFIIVMEIKLMLVKDGKLLNSLKFFFSRKWKSVIKGNDKSSSSIFLCYN